MATSSPPSQGHLVQASPPKASSDADPLSNPLRNALNMIEHVQAAGLAFAPQMPEPEALHAAARKAGITPREALIAYLTILHHD